jgi:hypothetical protein
MGGFAATAHTKRGCRKRSRWPVMPMCLSAIWGLSRSVVLVNVASR